MTTKGGFPHLQVAKLVILIFLMGIVWGFLFTSCKPIKETVTEYQTITIHDTIKGPGGQNIIVTRDSIVEVKKETIRTRWKTRFETKRFNDSLKHVRKVYSDSLRYAVKSQKIVTEYKYKEVKQKDKNDNSWKRVIPMILFLLAVIIYLLKKK
jgi:hypothetical protein